MSCRGSESIEKLRIDQRFCMKFTTHLTWLDPAQKSDGTLTEATCDEEAGMAAAAAELSGVLSTVGQGQIQGDATLDVWCEVIPPFNLMPRSALQVRRIVLCSSMMLLCFVVRDRSRRSRWKCKACRNHMMFAGVSYRVKCGAQRMTEIKTCTFPSHA